MKIYILKERYDLSEVGRVKLNSKLNLSTSTKKTILDTADVIAIIKFMLDLRDGKGDVDDIDHLGNRRVRSVGELVENQFRIGLLRMERTVKEKMSTFLEIESAMPQDSNKFITTLKDFLQLRNFNLWIKLTLYQITQKEEFPHLV